LKSERFNQRRAGLHHLCFRARSRQDVDEVHRLVQTLGARIFHPPEDGPWASGYYSLLFEDPDGIRLEINFVPGKGNLDPSVELPHRTQRP
jgi:catechol 2,3-dioxygenase-like lactoylglutathione lyase family enzyme